MSSNKLMIVGAFEDDAQDCSLCGKSKEGIQIQEEDGTELNWCWSCAKKLMRMRRLARSRSESESATFPAMRNGS